MNGHSGKYLLNKLYNINITRSTDKLSVIFCAIFLVMIFTGSISCPALEVRAKHLTMADGLPNNTIRFILQDSKGFVWLATRNGLSRYDGHNFKTILPNKNGYPGLADRRVTSLEEDKNGFLWVRMQYDKYGCYDLRNDRFVDITGKGDYYVNFHKKKLFNDCVWLWGNDGCLRVKYKNGHFTSERFFNGNDKLHRKKVRDVVKYGDKAWIVTDIGLYLYDKDSLKCLNTNDSFLCAAVRGNDTYLADSNGGIWTYDGKLRRVGELPLINGSYNFTGQFVLGNEWNLFAKSGAYVFDTNTSKLSRAVGKFDMKGALVKTDNRGDHWLFNNTGILKWVQVQTGKVKTFCLMERETTSLLDLERYSIVQAHNGIVWITTMGNGLYAYDTQTGVMKNITADGYGNESLKSNNLLSITEDRAGNIWVGTLRYGLSILTPTSSEAYQMVQQNGLDRISGTVRMIDKTANGIIIGNTLGDVFTTDTRLSEIVSDINEKANIYAAAYDKYGKLWLGSRNKGLYIDKKWIGHNSKNRSSLSENAIYDILCDRQGRMWIATLGGGINLAVPCDDGSYSFKHFIQHTPGKSDVRCLAMDHHGNIWAGTSDGLIVFNPERLIQDPKAFNVYSTNDNSLHGNEIHSIFCDSKGDMWITETGEGISVCKPDGKTSGLKFRHYGTTDGLINGMTQAVAEDRNGRIWVSTEYGLSCMNPKSASFRNFIFSTTMAENTYSENCAATLDDGRLVFGTDNGVAVVNPALLPSSDKDYGVVFTDMMINGMSINPGSKDYPLQTALPYTTKIQLKHNQNSFTIYFSTLEFSEMVQTQYTYWLERYDKTWSAPSTLDFASYKNLPSGTYYLHARGTNADGTMEEHESVLEIVIAPPLWASPFAYVIYAILILICVHLAFRTFRKMNALRTQMKVEEQLADYKLMFFTNISHEFRTPLSLIQAAMERIHRAENNSPERASAIELMDKSVNRMLRLVNELLEFRKAEKGKLSLQLENIDVVTLLKGYFDVFKKTAENKNMEYSFKTELQHFIMPVDRGKFDKIVYNLLSNAFKYTPAGGNVSVTAWIDHSENLFLLSVKDTGIGVSAAQRSSIFTRFTSNNISPNSIGIGLHLVHELVTVHKGRIIFEENQGGGSVFTVSIPADESVYQPSDYLPMDGVLIEEKTNTSFENTEKVFTCKNEISNKQDEIGVLENACTAPMNERTILIIEDDDDVRSLLVSELSAYITVVAKSDGSSGYEYARDNDIDLILCDVMMPGMDGFEVTSCLKNDFSTSHIPIILLTALGTDENKMKGLQSGADSYITKPFSMKLLVTRVLKTIEQREKLKEKFSNDITAVRPLISTTELDKKFVDKFTKIINENLSNSEFTIEDLALSFYRTYSSV